MNVEQPSEGASVEHDASRRQPRMALILAAYHHASDNIASQRFLGLLRYLPREDFVVHVLTASSAAVRGGVDGDPEIVYINGRLLSKASTLERLRVLTHILQCRPDAVERISGESWLARAVTEGRRQVQNERSLGRRVVVMATYSPIDALIAARLIADAEHVPLIQDFRDGLVYENLGRKGRGFQFLRAQIEAWAVRPAAIISTVSRPLVSHFERSYKGKSVELLYNGYDGALVEAEGNTVDASSRAQKARLCLGHFGRISASDAGQFETLRRLVSFLDSGEDVFSGLLEFYGDLTEEEMKLLSNSRSAAKFYGHVPREVVRSEMARMSALLIVTGERISVATGKIFEYLRSGRRILLVTRCWNEAARILQEIGDDDIVIDVSDTTKLLDLRQLEERLSRPFSRNFERIRRFEKSVQARQMANMLSRAIGHYEATRRDGQILHEGSA